ncbi:MAG: SDR family oxidoreductase [Planctomycetaceae bacterium]
MPTETALITGASSGIGRELAKLFAANGSRLILVARSEEKLQALAEELRQAHGVEVRVLPADLSRPEAPQQLYERLSAEGTEVDVLVNNAGFGKMERFQDVPNDTYVQMLELNVVSLTQLMRLFLPGMLARRRGGVLNVASTASFQPGPNAAVYYASKAYVRSMSEAVAEELRGTGVTVTALCPGPTKTGFAEVAEMDSMLLFKFAMRADVVANKGYRAFRAGKTTYVPGLGNKVLAFSNRFTPPAIVRKLIKAMQPVGK